MEILERVFEWLLILTFVGFIGTVIWIAVTAMSIKNSAMADAKRLYEPPLRSGKAIVATAKGIALQEKARFGRVSASVKSTTASVKDAAVDVKGAAQSIHPSDLQPAVADFKYILSLIKTAGQFWEAANKQGAKP